MTLSTVEQRKLQGVGGGGGLGDFCDFVGVVFSVEQVTRNLC